MATENPFKTLALAYYASALLKIAVLQHHASFGQVETRIVTGTDGSSTEVITFPVTMSFYFQRASGEQADETKG